MRLSYSAFATYDQCPAKYKFSYVNRLPRKGPGPAAERGTAVHDSIEAFMLEEGDLHVEISNTHTEWLEDLRDMYDCRPEVKWAVNDQWDTVDWHSPNAAWRGMFDMLIPPDVDGQLDIFEWKTGNIYDSHKLQAELYGLVGLLLWPLAERVRVQNVYIDKHQTVAAEWCREDINGLKALWERKYKLIDMDEIYPANPNWSCRYCDFSKQNGGPCQF